MGISEYPSTVTMPKADKPYPSILFFLIDRFPKVQPDIWEKRIRNGKVVDENGHPVTMSSEYAPLKRIFYFREVEKERIIPFAEKIIFQNNEILVSCKPHFLPVTPGGSYVDECLLNRLRKKTGNKDLVPLHRIDRETAGIVLFSVNRNTRGLYSGLFMNGSVEKTYQAVSEYSHDPGKTEWMVENRIVKGEPWFRMKTAPGKANSRSMINLVEVKENLAMFALKPVTGKTHQLRIHMSGLGFKILNDRYYPELQPEKEDDFDNPLQLIAKTIKFHDPVTGKYMEFRSERNLLF